MSGLDFRAFLMASMIFSAQFTTLTMTSEGNAYANLNYACVLVCEGRLEADLTACDASEAICKTGAHGTFALTVVACLRFGGTLRSECLDLAGKARVADLKACADALKTCLRRADRDYRNCKGLCSFAGGEPH